MAVVAALYGTEVIHFKRQDINELESIQAIFLAHLLGQRTSVSHIAVRKELGVNPIEQIMMDMKYWKISRLHKDHVPHKGGRLVLRKKYKISRRMLELWTQKLKHQTIFTNG